MDVSKLPRLSKTDPPPPAAPDGPPGADPDRAPARHIDYARREDVRPGVGAEVWLSAILGVVFIAMGWNFARYLVATLSGGEFHTGVNWTSGPKAGTEVGYFELQGGTAYTESGIFLFGVAMLLEAAALLAGKSPTNPRPWLVATGFAVALAATIYNAVVCVIVFRMGVFPILSILCVAFGGYIAMYEWGLLKVLRTERGAAAP